MKGMKLAKSMQFLGEKFCGVDRIILQSSTVLGGQRASSNHAFLPCFGTIRKISFVAESTYSRAIPVDWILSMLGRGTSC